MIPIGTDRPQRRFPLMNVLIIGVNVIVFLLSTVGAGHTPASSAGLSPWWTDGMLASTPRLYQFITYQFLHAGFMHLAGNMVFLYVFGNNLNEKLGHFRYLVFYLAGGILAGCGHLLTSDHATLGASGSIAAVTGLFLVLLPRTHVRVFFFLFYYADVFEIPSLYFIAFNIVMEIFQARFFPGSNVAHSAHFAGNAAGVLIGLILLLGHLVQRDHYDILSLINRYRRRKAYESLVAGGYNFYTAGSTTTPPPAPRLNATAPENPALFEIRQRIFAAIHARNIPAAALAYLELRQLDSTQVMPMREQLDIANQLMADANYPIAAAAYEDYLRAYPRGHDADQVQLILGMIYANYLSNPTRAIDLLRAAAPRLHSPAQRQLAESELSRLTSFPPPPA